MVKITDRKKAYEYLLANKCGRRNETTLCDELYKEFCLIGFIKEGMDGNWTPRWQVTDFGTHQMKTYLNFSKVKEKLLLIKEKL